MMKIFNSIVLISWSVLPITIANILIISQNQIAYLNTQDIVELKFNVTLDTFNV